MNKTKGDNIQTINLSCHRTDSFKKNTIWSQSAESMKEAWYK